MLELKCSKCNEVIDICYSGVGHKCKESCTIQKPPLGLRPYKIHYYHRGIEILEAMQRYTEKSELIPPEWVNELRAIYQSTRRY